MPEINLVDIQELKNPGMDNFRSIKPEHGTTIDGAREYWNGKFTDKNEIKPDLESAVNDYFKDVKRRSEYSSTIPDKPFKVSELRIRSPEENAKMREEFGELKAELKKQWANENGIAWPTYDHDVYINGNLIRKAGMDYDAHHVQPLSMGGENISGNITPLSAEVHFDRRGVHAFDSPYGKLESMLGEIKHD